MSIDQVIAAGDRVEFKAHIARCNGVELRDAWVKAARSGVQDFRQLAWDEMHDRRAELRMI